MTRLLSLVLIQGLVLISSAAAPAQESKQPAAARTQEQAAGSTAEAKKSPAESSPPRHSTRHEEGDDRRAQKRVVLQLRNADCAEVAELIEQAFDECWVTPMHRTNAIVYVGSEEVLPQVREFLAQVDVSAGEGEEQELTMIPVQQRRVDEIADAVSSLLAGRYTGDSVQIAKDRGRSALVLRGTKAATEKVREFVQQLDRPPSSVSLEFAFFQADAARPAGPVKVPTDLAPVAEELKKFGSVELAGRLTTVGVENDKFSIEGAITDKMPWLRVRGEVVSANAEGTVRLKVMAGLSLERQSPADAGAAEVKGQPTNRPARGPEFELETSVQTKRGDYVLLGSAPAGGAPGESVILVLHVRE
jgi:hypothetical protein